MRIRYLLMNAFSTGGTVRTTLQTAAALAERHDVEVVSIYKRRDDAAIPHDPRLRVRVLVDESPGVLAARSGPVGRATEAVRERLRARPSRLVHAGDLRYENFSALTDLALYRYLRTVRTDVLVGTRPGLNLAMARHAPRSIVRVGQDHLHIGTYTKELRSAMRRLYPDLDLYVTLTERDAEAWRTTLPARPTGDQRAERGPRHRCRPVAAHRQGRHRGRPADLAEGLRPADTDLAAGRRRAPGLDAADLRRRLPARTSCASLVAEHRLEGTVQLRGHSSRLHDEMRRASIFVMPSRFEGFPMILLEAMSCGLPPVVYDFPNGARELVTDGVNGRLLPERDAEGMAAALSQLMTDEELRRKLAQQAAAAVDGYRLDTIAARWEEIFAELVQARAERPR